MQSGLYVALSSQIALERRLTTIADNIANANTVGFRATGLKFDEIVNGIPASSTSFVSQGVSFLSSLPGGMETTGNALDFAAQGDVWFGLETPQGAVLTRDGRFQLTPEGALVNLQGYAVLDPGGAPIQLNPANGAPAAGRDGSISQQGTPVGAIGLFDYPAASEFQRFGSSGILVGELPEAAVDRSDVGVLQGFVEQSNVNALKELTSLIMVQRTFDDISALVRDSESSLSGAIKTLGSR
jgi:flagellar basal-body rod protein FlgF